MDTNENKQNDKEIFDGTRMSFGEHLAELRLRLLRSIYGLVVAFVVCLILGDRIIGLLARPLLLALRASELPVVLYAAAMPEAFVTYIKVALYSGVFLASPWILYQLWCFVAAGLYPREKRYVQLFVPFAAGLFVVGGLFFLFIVAPLSCNFFIKFGTRMSAPRLSDSFVLPGPNVEQQGQSEEEDFGTGAGPNSMALERESRPGPLIQPWFTLQKYVSLMLVLALAFSLAFQMPLVVFFLGRLSLFSLSGFQSARKYIFFGIVIVSALMTPPDVISQIALSLPMYALYELGILMLRLWPKEQSV